MKRFLKKRKMRGFTLVELLIVIIIIGILAGALLLVAGAGTDKAEATKIVSDLRTVKSSALLYYADYATWPESGDTMTDWLASWDEYGDREFNTTDLTIALAGSHIYVGRQNLTADSGVNEKLEDEANKNGGLYSDTAETDFSAGSTTVYMKLK